MVGMDWPENSSRRVAYMILCVDMCCAKTNGAPPGPQGGYIWYLLGSFPLWIMTASTSKPCQIHVCRLVSSIRINSTRFFINVCASFCVCSCSSARVCGNVRMCLIKTLWLVLRILGITACYSSFF